ncbi:hypothetical protein RJT34_00223 [Clitoria ternatea]|uniref:Disease resistance N-terminal domain-containing protein n=1 Tax=Clitoria ternatea TaxID=43366 RepID=A0AAN9KGW5_CLITE
MAEMAVSFAIDRLLPLVREEVNLLKGIHKDFADIKRELEHIQAFIKDADRKAAAEGENAGEGVKVWVKEVRETAFLIEDIIDEYTIHVGQQPQDPGFTGLLKKTAHLLKTPIPRHRIASETSSHLFKKYGTEATGMTSKDNLLLKKDQVVPQETQMSTGMTPGWLPSIWRMLNL